ncbi:MAG: UDP-N-acetylmuramoyl-L-alanine--D-glutamate ligase [Flavobacteriales bacterium]|jgi:UDP-N-acetylmuramoylalanine--D-glutamate ligase|tara:strand:- start:4902 stop:6218 length:1317 start_codon:yes stop_codon:yes gene_type:complete
MIAVLGAGESGVGAALLAQKKGLTVFVSDFGQIKEPYQKELSDNGIEWEQGTHTEERILAADILIKSPGIPETLLVKKARQQGIEVLSEIEFAYRYCKGKIVAITGSNGKTTTATLVHHLLKGAKLDVALAGNIGDSFARCLSLSDHDYWVLELSSFQLDDIHQFKPYIAILLNLSPDHLDRYEGEMENYVASKLRITENQDLNDYFIYWNEDDLIKKNLNKVKAVKLPFGEQTSTTGASLINETIEININREQLTMTIHELALQGKHNTYNSMAGGIAAKLLGITNDIVRECLSDFEKIEHRLEPVLKVYGVDYINDSKATNVNATWYALDSMTKSVVWICGGVDKGNNYEELVPLVSKKVKAIVCLGADNTKLIKTFGGVVDVIESSNSMEMAVKAAYKLAKKGDTVLLSPACASFDLFTSYEDRGRQFKKQIRLL